MHRIIDENKAQIIQIFKQHQVERAYVFGSVCTEKFNEKSDIDFIVAFRQKYFEGYVDNYFSLEQQLKDLLNREIDLVTEETLINPYFIKVVNKTKTTLYE